MKVCWVGIIGRPNVGKSTLLNNIIEYDLSITSNKVQTTRDQILGIYNKDGYQIIFLDTPGIHKAQSKFGDELNKKAYQIFDEVDLLLFLQPINEPIMKGDLLILEKIKKHKNKMALLTKYDLMEKNEIINEKIIKLNEFNFDYIIPISCKKMTNIEVLIENIKKYTYEDNQLYDEEFITDRSELFISKEIIRLCAIENLKDELPHSIAIEINKYDINDDENNRNIEAIIYCKKESQKGIIIGKNGSMIKLIGTQARKMIAHKFNSKVTLNIQVKVNRDWINNEKQFKKFGY